MPMSELARPLTGVTLAALVQVVALAQQGAPTQNLYTDFIRPVFEKSCNSCHSSQTKSSGLDLSSRDGLLRGGERGPAIVPGDPKSSLLYKTVAHEAEPHMPLKSDRL